MTPLTRFVTEVDVDLDSPDGDSILTNITTFILAHPLAIAVLVITLILMKAAKNRTIRSGMLVVGGILIAVLFLIPFGVID